MRLANGLLALLVFPGLLFAMPCAWFFVWIERKTVAWMQRRIGPPLLQPFLDFVKLLAKRTPQRYRADAFLMQLWPLLSVAAMAGALALLPVFPHSTGFSGDLVLLVMLLELPSVFTIVAGFSSRSLFGEIGSTREALFSLGYSVVFLAAFGAIALSSASLRLQDAALATANPARWIALLAILLCIPAKLRLNPFSTASAEQEIYSGPLTEYAGPELAFWELAHGLEWVALTGVIATFALPRTGAILPDAAAFVAGCVCLVLLLSLGAAATARFTLRFSLRIFWRWGFTLALVALASASFLRMKP